MKPLLISLVLTASIATAYSQGQLLFNTFISGTYGAPIYDFNPQNPTVSLQGQGSGNLANPMGGVNYSGHAPLAGTGFTAQLWGGLTASTLSAPVTLAGQTVPTGTRNFSTVPALAGHLSSGVTAQFNQPAGTVLVLQVRAWNNMNGTVTSWAQVLAGQNVARGWSITFNSPPLTEAPTPPSATPGMTSFSLTIPEPSLLALGALGLGALWLGRIWIRR